MSDHVPNPTDVVGTVDTTGINPGPHSTLEGVSPIFELTKASNEKSVDELFAEQALAAGTEEYQADNPVDPHPSESEPFPPMDETPDTTATGGRAPADTINRDLPPITSSDQEQADHTDGKSTSQPADGGSDGGSKAAGGPDTGSGDLAKRKVTQLTALARAKGVDLTGKTKKDEIVPALKKAGVTNDD